MTLEQARAILEQKDFPQTAQERADFLTALKLVAGSFAIPPQG